MNSTINDVPAPVLNADLALLLCAEVWGFPESSPGQATPWQRLQPEWCARLVTAAERSEGPGREKALAFLRQSHRLQSKAEPDRVHPSWWIRALKDESPAVRRLIATHGPVPVCTAARAAFGFRKENLETAQSPNSEAIEWVQALWAERLVGGEPPQRDEPPVILALACLHPPVLYRLCHAIGLAQTTLEGDPRSMLGVRPAWQVEQSWYTDWFRREAGADIPQLPSTAGGWPAENRRANRMGRRRELALLGLTSLARLLLELDTFRVRWALQHVPYSIAKRIRSIMAVETSHHSRHLQMDSILLRAAWQRLAMHRSGTARHPEDAPGKPEGAYAD